MGKQSNKPTLVSQEQYNRDLDKSLEILHNDGASDQELIDYTNDYKSRFTVEKTKDTKPTTQKKNPNANKNGVSNSGTGSSGSQKIDPKTGFPKIDANGILPNFDEMKSASKPIVAKPTQPKTKGDYAKSIAAKAYSEYDPNLTEERLQTEKEQSGFLNNASKAAKTIWNVAGEALGAVNETFGGDSDYFTIDEYKPLQDEKKQYIQQAQQQGLPITKDAVQKGAEAIFRKNDRIQQVEKRIDAHLPEDYDRQGIWKDLKLENLKKNDKLRSAVASIDIYQKNVEEFDKYATYIKGLPKNQLTQDKVDKYNRLLDESKESIDALKYYQDNFPKLLKEVKSSDELLDVMKYNYNDYEKAYSNIKNFGKRLGWGTLKIAAETASYIDQKTDDGSAPTSADKTFKKVLQATKDVSNEELDQASKEGEQFVTYKAKDLSNISDIGSYMADLGTNQLPVYITLAVAPEFGSALLGTSSAGDQFRNMEKEEMQPFAKQTSFGQKLATSYIYGAAETLFEKLGTVSILSNIEKSIARASNGSRRLVRDSVLSSVSGSAKRLGYNTFLEGGTELLTAEAQIQADRNIAGKEISTQKANENRFESFVGGALMGNTMTIAGGLWGGIAQQAKLYSDNKDIKKTTEILSKIDGLSDELKNNPNLTKEDKDIIHKKMTVLADESFGIVTKNAERGKTFSKQESDFLVAVNLMHDGLKKEFEEVKNSNLSTEQKEQMTKDLNNQFNALEKNRNATLQGEFNSIPDIEKNIVFERANHDNPKLNGITPLNDDENISTAADFLKLPKEETTRLKNEAARELIKEKNPDGKDGNFTVTDEEITKRAIDNFNKANETKTPTPEAQSQAEVPQQAKNEALKEGRYEYQGKTYTYDGSTLTDESGNLYPLSFEKDNLLENIKKEGVLVEEATTEEPITDQEALDALDDTEEDNTETPTETVETPTETKPTLSELADQEYLDFVENDFLSDERLNDIAAKVLENKDLNTYEKRIAKKKEKEIVAINKKVQDDANETNRKAEVDTLSKIPSMEKDEFLEYTNTEKASEERLNSIAYKTANNIELNNFEAEVYQDNKKEVDKINKAKNLKENILDKVPTEQKHTTKEGKYTVAKNGKELELYDNNGQPVSVTPATKQKYFLEALENGFMKRTTDLPIPEGISETEIETFEVENETDPSVILEKLLTTDPEIDGENVADVKDYAIAIYINKVTQGSFIRFGDRNYITKGIALTYFSKDGAPIDTLAQEISLAMGIEVEPQDVVDFIIANPNGARSVLSPKNPAYQNLIDKFVELTGFRPNPSQIMDFKAKKEVTPTQIDVEFANEVEVNNKIADDIIDLVQAQEEFDKWFSTLTTEEQTNFYFDLEQDYPNKYYQQRYNEQQEYEKSEKTTGTATPNTQGESKPNGSMGQNPQQAGSGKGNNNVPKRGSGEIKPATGGDGGTKGNANAGINGEREQGGIEDNFDNQIHEANKANFKEGLSLDLLSENDILSIPDKITDQKEARKIYANYKRIVSRLEALNKLIDCK